MTGEIADGWLGTSFMPEHARVFFDHLEAGAVRAGRSLAHLDLQAGGVVAFSDDVERLIPPRKPGLAFSLGAMGSRQHNFYNDAFKRAGYRRWQSKSSASGWTTAGTRQVTRVPDELVLKTNFRDGRRGAKRLAPTARRDHHARVEPAGENARRALATLGE